MSDDPKFDPVLPSPWPVADEEIKAPPPCDIKGCDHRPVLIAFAAYDHAPQSIHPLVARYPNPIVRACYQHLILLLLKDDRAEFGTHQWVVKRA